MILVSSCRFTGKSPLLLLVLLSSLFLLVHPTPSPAQTQQPFLFATQGLNGELTGIAVFVRDDQTGNLTEVSNSPFTAIHSTHCSIGVVDPKGRFGYGVCGLGASMYSLDSTSGAAQEVIGSPFAESTNTDLIYLAAESTGQFVYVLKANPTALSSTISTVLLDTFQVDSTGLQLVPLTSHQFQLDGALASVAATQHGFYLFVNQNQNPVPTAELEAILFDPLTGQSSTIQPLLNLGISVQRLLPDTLGKNLILVSGQTCANLWFASLSPADGSVSLTASANLTCGVAVSPVAFDPAGNFVYLRFSDSSGTHIFDFSSGFELASSPLPATLESEIGGQADPQGPYSYLPGPAPNFGVSVFGIDSTTGYPVLPTAFTTPLFSGRELLVGPATASVNGQPVQVPKYHVSRFRFHHSGPILQFPNCHSHQYWRTGSEPHLHSTRRSECHRFHRVRHLQRHSTDSAQ